MLASAVGREGFDGVRCCVEIRREALEERWLAIEGDDGNFVLDVADDGFEHGRKRRSDGGEFVELAGSCAADLDEDYEGEGFAVRVLFKAEFLWDAVVGESEVAGVESEDEIAGFVADECGNEDESRAGA